jgi:hypothetical protein
MFGRRNKAERPEPFPTDHAGDELQNRALVDAMRAVSVDDTAATRALLFQLLLDSHLVVLSPSEPAEHRTWTAEKGDTLQLVTFSDDQGTVLPVFTSVDALLRFRPDGGGYAALPASALFQMADAGGTGKILIDPESPTNGYVTRSEIEALGRGRLPIGGSEVVTTETQIRIGRPAQPPPPDVLDAVRSSLSYAPGASRAWLTMIQQGESTPEVVIAVRFDESADNSEMRNLIDRAGAMSPGISSLRFLTADSRLAETLDSGAGEVIFAR